MELVTASSRSIDRFLIRLASFRKRTLLCWIFVLTSTASDGAVSAESAAAVLEACSRVTL